MSPATDQDAMLHVVYDTKGAGRIVGIFQDRERAERVCAVDEAYFRLTTVALDSVNPSAIEWLNSDEKRRQLSRA